MEIEEFEEEFEGKTIHSASATSLQDEVQEETNEIEDNIETAIDKSPTKESSYEELPIVEEELAPVVLTKEEEEAKVVASEVAEEDDLPTETVDDASVMGDHTSTTIGSLDDPFLLVGKKLSSSNATLSSMRQDSLQYSISSKATTAANTSTLQNHDTMDDDSLFNDVDNDMSQFVASSEKKNLDEEKPTRKEENDNHKPPSSSIKTIKSLSQDLVKDTFETASKTSPRSPKSSRNANKKEEGNEEMKSDLPPKNDDTPSTVDTKSKVKKLEKEKGKVTKEEKDKDKEKEKSKEEKEKEKEKLPFRAKKGLPKSSVIPTSSVDPKDIPLSDLTPQEMADQAEKQALQQKKEREEKLQLKKLKRNIEKLQQPEDQNKENEHEDAQRRKSVRGKEDKEKNESIAEDKPKRSNRRLSKEKPETKDHEHDKPHDITDTEAEKQPVRSYLKRKVPSTLKKEENLTDNDHHLPDVIQSSRRHTEKEDNKDPTNDSLNPQKRKVHPSKFPAIIRNKVHQIKEKFELETSADDSSINTEKRQRIRVPFSSPSERGHNSENNSEAKPRKRKPLYLRLEEKARRLRMQEEKMKHDAYVQLRNKRYKQPTREEIKEHMKHFDELLKLKSEEFKQNHVSQMRQLRQQKQQQQKTVGDGEGMGDDNNSVMTNNNPWDSDLLPTPKKPNHTKKDSSKVHQQHRSVRKKSKENQDEDFHDGNNGDDEAEKELLHDEMMLNNMSSIQDFLVTTEDHALDNKKIDDELKSPNELKAASNFIPVTAPSTENKPELLFSAVLSPRIDSPGKDLPNEEIASLLETDWIGRMKE